MYSLGSSHDVPDPQNVQHGSPPSDISPDAETGTILTLVQDLRLETATLRAETAQLQQQNLSYRETLQSMRSESLRWIIGLAGLMVIGFAGFAAMLWRVAAIKPGKRDTMLAKENPEIGQPEPSAGASTAEMRQAPVPAGLAPGASFDVPVADRASPVAVNTIDATPSHDEPEHQFKAEEFMEIMKLVDMWMAHNAPDKALELLQPFTEVRQPASPLPWLCLLDVYRVLGDQEKYEVILARIKTVFNVKLAPWHARASHQPPKTLADFPHIIDEILGLWQSAGVVPYLKSLLRDDRNGTRHGFDLPVYRDIIQLIALASDPDRLTTRGNAMPQQASAILFGTC
jgi:pilus assembly protein FimV